MSQKGKIFYRIIIAATFIALEVAAFAILSYNGPLQNAWLSKSMHGFYAVVWGGSESVKRYFSLKKENEELAQRNFELSQRLRLYKEKYGTQFSGSLPSDAGCFNYIPASIVKMSRNRQSNYVILDKGQSDGVAVMSGIITEKGVVGIVDAVSRNYSHVRMFTTAGMAVSARIGHEGAVGTLTWDGIHSNRAILGEIPHHIEITPGDTLYTSGYSAIFPPDIPLGTIGDKKLVNGSSYEIQVELLEDFSKLRYVTVVENNDVKEIEDLENEE